jgi:hypothetical protein
MSLNKTRRFAGAWVVAIFICALPALVSPALAGITVTSYTTTALTNGFAPSFQGPYFAQETLENVTPALADVSGDWIGSNSDGTPATWHFVGASQSSSTTTFDANSYTVAADGSFEYELDTTAQFVDPRPTVLTPGGAANYEGFFNTDVPVAYSIVGLLNQHARVRLNTLSGSVIFNQSNPTSVPMPVNLAGTIPAGQYRVFFTTGVGVPNFPNGVNHFEARGSYEGVIFAVQVPEPTALSLVISIIGASMRRARRGDRVE